MSQIIIGNVTVDVKALRNLSCLEKIFILEAMFDDGLLVDNDGEIIQHTDMMYDNSNVIPLVKNPESNSEDNHIPYEEEEEPISSGPISEDEFAPDTVRLPNSRAPEFVASANGKTCSTIIPPPSFVPVSELQGFKINFELKDTLPPPTMTEH